MSLHHPPDPGQTTKERQAPVLLDQATVALPRPSICYRKGASPPSVTAAPRISVSCSIRRCPGVDFLGFFTWRLSSPAPPAIPP